MWEIKLKIKLFPTLIIYFALKMQLICLSSCFKLYIFINTVHFSTCVYRSRLMYFCKVQAETSCTFSLYCYAAFQVKPIFSRRSIRSAVMHDFFPLCQHLVLISFIVYPLSQLSILFAFELSI